MFHVPLCKYIQIDVLMFFVYNIYINLYVNMHKESKYDTNTSFTQTFM